MAKKLTHKLVAGATGEGIDRMLRELVRMAPGASVIELTGTLVKKTQPARAKKPKRPTKK